MRLIGMLRLLRLRQWYKNLVIFAGLIFAGRFFYLWDLKLTIIGFLALCFVSSANYIINDIVDAKEDRIHPRKKHRPIASGKVNIWEALILAIFMFVTAIAIAAYISIPFLTIVITLFAVSQSYSFFLKNEPFLDIILIGVNFVIRALSGTLIISVEVSPWLIICAFFLAIYIAAGKRYADLRMLGRKAKRHKKVYRLYNEKILETLLSVNMSVLIVSYSLYTFLKGVRGLILSLPIVMYAIYRYNGFILQGSDIAREPERIFTDSRTVFAVFLWGVVVLAAIYLK